MARQKIIGTCSCNGCDKPIHAKGMCRNHYITQWNKNNEKNPYDGKTKRRHPLYIMWHQRKQDGVLCNEWKYDFWLFVSSVGPKPEGNYFLLTIDASKPYGPDNFKWQEHLKRKPGEPRKEWWARKWAARQAANPGHERRRNLKRKYGITQEQFDEMHAAQNGICAICKKPEQSVDGKTGSLKRLAVDHCHSSNKVRALLCWRCNSVLGKIEESTEILSAMIAYIEEHKGD